MYDLNPVYCLPEPIPESSQPLNLVGWVQIPPHTHFARDNIGWQETKYILKNFFLWKKELEHMQTQLKEVYEVLHSTIDL